MVAQSRRNPDGTGLGFFEPDGAPQLDKEPLAAFEDGRYAREARHLSSTTFVSHIRYATTGERTVENTHPFAQDGRVFAHNGVLGDLPRLEAELGPDRDLVLGQTDSERYFALITKRIRELGDVEAGIAAAVNWIADTVPVYSINFVLSTPTDLWAFRYPETHRLFVLEREAGGPHGGRALTHSSELLHVHSPELADRPAVVVASEPLDDHPGWRLLEVGELLHASSGETVSSRVIVDHPPAQLIHIDHPTGQAAS